MPKKTDALLQLKGPLLQAREAQSLLVLSGGLAHQFNNVLTGLMGNVDLLALNCPDHADVHRFVDHARAACDRMTGLTRQLMAYVQGHTFKPGIMSVDSLLDLIYPALRRLVCPSVDLGLERSPSDDMVNADATQMQMALCAIVKNADEAIAGDGWIRIAAHRLDVSDARLENNDKLPCGRWLRIGVEDSGKGMEPDTLQRVFTPFFTTRPEGSGLGMTMTLEVVKNHQGHIRVASRINEGTRVSIYLPLIS